MKKYSSEEYYVRMTQTPVSKLVISLGIPTIISMLVTNIYNMADTYFVGTQGTSASGAVGIVFGLMAIIQAFGFMFGHGAGSIIARLLGKKEHKQATEYASVAFFAAFLMGVLVCIFGMIFIDPFMRLMGSTETILPYAREYAGYILIAAPFMASSCVFNNILRYEGKALLAMIGLASGGIINIFGDYIFMVCLDMGITGAGLSTAISQTISFFILLSQFALGRTQSKIYFKEFIRNVKKTGLISKTGFPSLIRQGLASISTMLLNGQAAAYEDVAVAAMSIVNRISFFVCAIGIGIGQGFQPVVAFNYGAKKYGRVKDAYRFTLLFSEIVLGVLAIVGMIFSGNLVGVFRDDPAVIEIGTFALRMQLIAVFFQPFSVCSNMLFQSIGRNLEATVVSMLRSGLCFIPILLLLSALFGLTGIQLSQTVADIVSFFITVPFVVKFFKYLPADELFC